MQLPTCLASIALLASAIGTPVLAGGQQHSPAPERLPAAEQHAKKDLVDQGMQVVPHGAAAGALGHGWRYFSDPTTPRAVVISPQGDYYYSRGKGLQWIAAEQL